MLLLLRRFSRVRLCATPQMAAHQAPPSLGFSRQEHWSGLPFPSPMREKWKWSRSVVFNSMRPHRQQPTRLLYSMGFSRQEYWSGLPLLSPYLGIRLTKYVQDVYAEKYKTLMKETKGPEKWDTIWSWIERLNLLLSFLSINNLN